MFFDIQKCSRNFLVNYSAGIWGAVGFCSWMRSQEMHYTFMKMKLKNIHVPVSPVSRSVHSLNWKVPPEQACHNPSLTSLRRRLSSVTCTYLQEGTETATIIKMVATAVNTDVAIDRKLVHNFIVFLKEVFRFPQKNWAECYNRVFTSDKLEQNKFSEKFVASCGERTHDLLWYTLIPSWLC